MLLSRHYTNVLNVEIRPAPTTWITQDQTGELLSVRFSRFRRRQIGNTALRCFISRDSDPLLAATLAEALRMRCTEGAVGKGAETWEQVYYSSIAKHRHAHHVPDPRVAGAERNVTAHVHRCPTVVPLGL